VLRETVPYAQSKNVIVVAAYGNDGRQSPGDVYPANYPGVIPVMSVDGKDQRAAFSNCGRAGVVAAPGVNVISTYPTLMYKIGSGTSFSAPWVAASAALLRSHFDNATAARVQAYFLATGVDVDLANAGQNAGRLDLVKALSTPMR
jgi:subtilisin family serine protease